MKLNRRHAVIGAGALSITAASAMAARYVETDNESALVAVDSLIKSRIEDIEGDMAEIEPEELKRIVLLKPSYHMLGNVGLAVYETNPDFYAKAYGSVAELAGFQGGMYPIPICFIEIANSLPSHVREIFKDYLISLLVQDYYLGDDLDDERRERMLHQVYSDIGQVSDPQLALDYFKAFYERRLANAYLTLSDLGCAENYSQYMEYAVAYWNYEYAKPLASMVEDVEASEIAQATRNLNPFPLT